MMSYKLVRTSVFLLVLGFLPFSPVLADVASSTSSEAAGEALTPRADCESFARRQMKLAGRLLDQDNYSRAVKVLNSTMDNCERDFIQKRIYKALSQWYDSIARGGTTAEFREFEATLAEQKYLNSAQKRRLERRLQGFVKALIQDRYESQNYESTYQMCRKYESAAESNFELQYYCGSSAEKLGAVGVAMNSYSWMLDNWSDSQSVTTWGEIAGNLESLYYLHGRFDAGYELAQKSATLDPSPKSLLSSLIAMRASFLAPLVDVAGAFFEKRPGTQAVTHFNSEMQRVGLPNYVKSMYMLRSDGGLLRGMYGKEANQPSASLLGKVSESTALLTPKGGGRPNRAWLVTPVEERYLVLEFNTNTTPQENILLENVLSNVRSDREWDNLYDLQFKNAVPGAGSAIGTMLSSTFIEDGDFETYDSIFEDSPVLLYYSLQNEAEEIKESYNFNRSKLGYGDKEWERSSTTPALYHHSVQYDETPVREVVWPNFVNDQWSGVIRVGFVQS